MPLFFSERLPSPLRCRLSFTSKTERWLMQTSRQTLQQEAHKEDTNPRWHVSLSGGCLAGAIFVAMVSWDLWKEGLAIPGLFLHTCAQSAVGWHFKLYHLSQERLWLLWRALLPAATPLPPPTSETSHPSLEIVLGKRRQRFPQWEAAAAASQRPYCLLAPNWFEGCKIILIT